MNTAAQIIASLEIVAERSGDITPTVFDHYYTRCPASQELMNHMDEHMLGRMIDQVLLLMMEDGEDELQSYLSFETSAHASYGVEFFMYENLFAAVRQTIGESLGADFAGDFEAAWDSRISFLLSAISVASEGVTVAPVAA